LKKERRDNMYKIMAVTRARAGKLREAIGLSKEMAEHVTSKYDVKLQVHLQQFGPTGTIYSIGEVKDLATMQTIQGKLITDEGYWAIVRKSAEIIDPPNIVLLQQL
jgi:hypothetical protein